MPKKKTYKQIMKEILTPKNPKEKTNTNITKSVGGGDFSKISQI
tara:strand:+ start:847 stop:978 length:132 start_codon:yes stop_codon:yes gene_type:complete